MGDYALANDYCPTVADERYVEETVGPKERVRLMECYVRDAMEDPQIKRYAHHFASLDPKNPAQAIVDGQNRLIRYGLDCGDGTCELLRRGRLILQSGWGDCKKKSIITAAMMRIVGIKAMVVWLHQQDEGAQNNHVAVQMCKPGTPKGSAPTAVQVYLPDNAPKCNAGWVWVETTLPGAIVGRDPYQELERLGPANNRNSL